MVQAGAGLEVAYRILDLGVTAMIDLEFERLPVPVGDEAVIAGGGEESQLRTVRRLHPTDDEPYRRGVRLGLEWGVGGHGRIGWHRPSSKESASRHLRRIVLDEIPPRRASWRMAMAKRTSHPAADCDHFLRIEAAVGPHRELAAGSAGAHPGQRFTQ